MPAHIVVGVVIVLCLGSFFDLEAGAVPITLKNGPLVSAALTWPRLRFPFSSCHGGESAPSGWCMFRPLARLLVAEKACGRP